MMAQPPVGSFHSRVGVRTELAVIRLDPAGMVADWNAGAECLISYQAAEVLGRPCSQFYAPHDVAIGTPQRHLRLALTQGGFEEQGCCVRKKGIRFPAVISVTPLRNDQGRHSGFTLVVRDLTEHEQVEAALSEQRDRLRQILDSMYVFVGVFTTEGIVVKVNKAPLEAAGLRPEDVIGKPFPETFWWTHSPEVQNDVRFALRTAAAGRQVRFDATVRVAGGRLITVDATFSPIVDVNGRVVQVVGSGVDISDRKCMEDLLRKSNDRYKAAIDAARQLVFEWNPLTDEVSFDGDIEGILGYSREELSGGLAQWVALVHPDDKAALLVEADRIRSGEAGVQLEFRVRRKNGAYVILQDRASVFPVAHGQGHRVFGCVIDVTAQRTAERLFRAVVDYDINGIVLIDDAGIIRMVNHAAEKLLGYEASEIVGQSVARLMEEPHRSRHNEYVARYLRTGEARIIGIAREVAVVRKNGSTFPADLSVSHFDLDGRPHFLGILRDVSEKKKMEEHLLQSQKMQAIGHLAGGVAHDFNNILTVISIQCELLNEMLPADDSRRKIVSEILGAGERGASLTKQLLAFSRKQVLNARAINVNDVVAGMETMLKRLIGEHIHLKTQFDSSIGAVKVDPVQLEQVILKLVMNARDAMPAGGNLTISTQEAVLSDADSTANRPSAPGRYVLLTVTDTGIGMSQEILDHIFEPFYTTKDVGMGTGLGLATAYGIVNQSRGHIAVSTELAVGTTFKVFLPVVLEQPETSVADKRRDSFPRGGETILLVEDEESPRNSMKFALETYGYRVLVACNGKDAIDVIERQAAPVDLVITDVVMPVMGGRDLSDHLRRRDPPIKVMFISGYMDDDAGLSDHIVAGNVDFLQKPFSVRSLTSKVRELLDRNK